MKTGLLWYDDNPSRSFVQKVAQAAARHTQKYGSVPNVCYVHSDTNPNKVQTVGVVKIETGRQTVLPHHFWIGREEKK